MNKDPEQDLVAKALQTHVKAAEAMAEQKKPKSKRKPKERIQTPKQAFDTAISLLPEAERDRMRAIEQALGSEDPDAAVAEILRKAAESPYELQIGAGLDEHGQPEIAAGSARRDDEASKGVNGQAEQPRVLRAWDMAEGVASSPEDLAAFKRMAEPPRSPGEIDWELESVKLQPDPVGGTFIVHSGGQSTELPHDATEEQIQEAIRPARPRTRLGPGPMTTPQAADASDSGFPNQGPTYLRVGDDLIEVIEDPSLGPNEVRLRPADHQQRRDRGIYGPKAQGPKHPYFYDAASRAAERAMGQPSTDDAAKRFPFTRRAPQAAGLPSDLSASRIPGQDDQAHTDAQEVDASRTWSESWDPDPIRDIRRHARERLARPADSEDALSGRAVGDTHGGQGSDAKEPSS